MPRKLRKTVLLIAKIAVAAVLAVWVLGRVHWHDCVIDARTNETFSVLGHVTGPDGRVQFNVAKGILWWRRTQVRPAGDFVMHEGVRIRPGFASTIKAVKLPLLLAGMAGFLMSVLTVSVRWWFLLRIQDIHISRLEAVRLTFLGYFFSLIVPGTVGGDVVKAYYAAKHTPRKAAALVSVFVDRVLGLTEMAMLATVTLSVTLLCGLAGFREMRVAVYAICMILVLVAGILSFLFSRRFRRLFRLQKFYMHLPIAHHISAAGEAATLYRRRLGALGKAIALTFGAHVIWVTGISLVGLSLSVPTAFYRYFVYIPIIYIIGSIPISPGGFGVIESLYVQFFAVGAITASQILPLALLARLIPMFWTLPGLMVAITGPKVPAVASMEAELGLEADCEGQGGGDGPPAGPQSAGPP